MVDGRTLPRPVNYVLVGIVPSADVTIDPGKRPFIIFDPRAGHGPGIGGMKHDSEIGVALKAGHACFFVGFLPKPVPGQTIEDVCAAEAYFVRVVSERHKEADGKPTLIGFGRVHARDASESGFDFGRFPIITPSCSRSRSSRKRSAPNVTR